MISQIQREIDIMISQIQRELEHLNNINEDMLECDVTFKVKPQLEMNLWFTNTTEHKIIIEETLRKRKFIYSYPISLKIKQWYIDKKEYGSDELNIIFTISKKDYVEHLYNEYRFYSFKYKPCSD